MDTEKEDRRTRRTRQLLRDAFLALLREKEYAAITVQDIIDRADVARSTFYTHYLDKEDLLVGQWGVFAGNLGGQVGHGVQEDHDGPSLLPTRAWFYHIQTQKPVLKTIVRNSAMDLAMRNLYKMLRNDIQNRLQPHLPNDENASIPSPVLVDYLTGALMTLINWWVTHEMPYTPERMDEIFQQLVMPGVASALKITA